MYRLSPTPAGQLANGPVQCNHHASGPVKNPPVKQ